MPDVDYKFYTGTFHGKVSEADFTRLKVYASAYLDERTMGRINDDLPEETVQKVKLALCALVDAYHQNEKGGTVAAETNDGVSVTYAVGTAKSESRRLYDALALFLGPTGLLYRGVM